MNRYNCFSNVGEAVMTNKESLKDLVVVKRSGQRVSFNDSKIAIAIKKGFDDIDTNANEENVNKVFEKVLEYIINNYQDRKTINVEDIQDIIEKKLQDEGFNEVYIAFKKYRERRALSRKVFNEKQTHKFVRAIEKVEEKLTNHDEFSKPNEVLLKYGKIIASEYAKSYVLDNKYVRACDEGNIYIHNLDYFALGTIPRLNIGLSINNEDDYLDDFISEIINIRKEVNDNIGINSIDNILASFLLNKFKNTLIDITNEYFSMYGLMEYIGFKKIEDSINRLKDIEPVNNLDILLNSQSRNIFNIAYNNTFNYIDKYTSRIIKRLFKAINNSTNYSVSLSTNNSKLNMLIKNKIIDYVENSDYLVNVNLIIKVVPNLDSNYLDKISNLIVNKKNISLAFINNSYNIGNKDVEYFSDGNRIYDNINDNENSSNGRMIVAATSINLARLGIKYQNGLINNFYNELDQLLEFTKNELILHFETTGDKNKENYEILFNGNVLGDERLEEHQKIRKIIKTGVLNIGLVGLEECVISLCEDTSKRFETLTKLLNYLNNKCKKYTDETKLNFCIFEPSDLKVRRRLIELDKAIYGIGKLLKNKNEYGLISESTFVNDYDKLAKIQKLIKGGNLVNIAVKNANNKKIVDLIKKLIDVDIGFVKIEVVT
jgi:ribonucleoside-triphosphate reductase